MRLTYFLRGDKRYECFKESLKILDKSREEILEIRDRKLRRLVHHAYKTVPYYRELVDSLDFKPEDFKTADDLKKLPKLDKKTIMKNEKRLTTEVIV